jgi:hypothetical protein
MILAVPAGYASLGGFSDMPAVRIVGTAIFLASAIGFFWNLVWHLD